MNSTFHGTSAQDRRDLSAAPTSGLVYNAGEIDVSATEARAKKKNTYYPPAKNQKLANQVVDGEIVFTLESEYAGNGLMNSSKRANSFDSRRPVTSTLNGLGKRVIGNGAFAHAKERARIQRSMNIAGLAKEATGTGSGRPTINIQFGGNADPRLLGDKKISAGQWVYAYLPTPTEYENASQAGYLHKNGSSSGRITLWFRPYDKKIHRLTSASIMHHAGIKLQLAGAGSELDAEGQSVADTIVEQANRGDRMAYGGLYSEACNAFASAMRLSALVVIQRLLEDGFLAYGNTSRNASAAELLSVAAIIGEMDLVPGNNLPPRNIAEDVLLSVVGTRHTDRRVALFPGVNGQPDDDERLINATVEDISGVLLDSVRDLNNNSTKMIIGKALNAASPGHHLHTSLDTYMLI